MPHRMRDPGPLDLDQDEPAGRPGAPLGGGGRGSCTPHLGPRSPDTQHHGRPPGGEPQLPADSTQSAPTLPEPVNPADTSQPLLGPCPKLDSGDTLKNKTPFLSSGTGTQREGEGDVNSPSARWAA